MMKREENKDGGVRSNLLWCPPSRNPRPNFSPKKWLIFRVWELKTYEKWRSREEEDKGSRMLYL
jgi:hypothetical protein